MRLWTLHPRHLDARGLVALWREALLAQKVLLGKTKGYRHHPQLCRFRACADPVAAIAAYLEGVRLEAVKRGYRFDGRKIAARPCRGRIRETRGQVLYEWKHLARKLRQRCPGALAKLRAAVLTAHPLFLIVPGRRWEGRLTTHDARRTTHDARRMTHDARRITSFRDQAARP